MLGTSQRAAAGAVDSTPTFAIRADNGVYLRSLARDGAGRASFGRDRARRYSRAAGVAALHIVRAAGRRAWLVRHPGSIGGAL